MSRDELFEGTPVGDFDLNVKKKYESIKKKLG